MNNFITNTYEMKREFLNFSKKICGGNLNNPTTKFVMDIQYGLAKGGSCLISNIARNLDENIRLNYTIDRLCDNLSNLHKNEKEKIWSNYLNEVSKCINKDEAIVLMIVI